MHLNKVVLIGRAGEHGPKLTYNEQAVPTCSFTLEVDEVSQTTGNVFTRYIPVEVVGKYAEAAAAKLEAGQEVMVDGKLRCKKVTDRSGRARNKLIVSTWNVSQAPVPAMKGA